MNNDQDKKTPEQAFEKLFEVLTAELEHDLDIDDTDLDGEIIRTPKLFTKWRNKLSIESMNLVTLTNKKNKLYKDLYLYFLKKAPDSEYKRKGAVHYTIPKSDLNTFIYADVEWIQHQLKLEYQTQIVRYIENALTRIAARQHEIREIIKWKLFLAGEH